VKGSSLPEGCSSFKAQAMNGIGIPTSHRGATRVGRGHLLDLGENVGVGMVKCFEAGRARHCRGTGGREQLQQKKVRQSRGPLVTKSPMAVRPVCEVTCGVAMGIRGFGGWWYRWYRQAYSFNGGLGWALSQARDNYV